jgi:hypothetical protein
VVGCDGDLIAVMLGKDNTFLFVRTDIGFHGAVTCFGQVMLKGSTWPAMAAGFLHQKNNFGF